MRRSGDVHSDGVPDDAPDASSVPRPFLADAATPNYLDATTSLLRIHHDGVPGPPPRALFSSPAGGGRGAAGGTILPEPKQSKGGLI